MLVTELFLGELQHTNLLTPDKDPTTDQSMDTTQVQMVNQQVLLGL